MYRVGSRKNTVSGSRHRPSQPLFLPIENDLKGGTLPKAERFIYT